MTDIHLNIVSPEKVLVDLKVDKVTFPGTRGPFTVLKNHAPLISSLEKGVIKYSVEGKQESISINSGFVELKDNELSVCVEV